MNLGKQFKEGLITNNPVLVQVLGMCSTMAITTSFFNGLGMGVAVTVILTLSNVIIAAIRKIVPDKIRIAMFIVVIAGFVTCVDLLIQAFVPALSESLGVFIPLIVVNCIILGRAESFSYKNGVAASFWDGIFQGFGYTVVLMVMCIIREFLGAGTFGGGILNGGDGIQILPEQFPIGMLTLPVGGFLGVSKKVDTAVGMGIAVTFVMGLASAVCYAVNEFVLVRFGLEYMQTVTFILVIASLVQFVEMFLQKSMPSLYTALGVYLPLITTNCAVLGVVLLNVQNNYNFISSVVYGITGGLGFLLAIVLFASIRERLVFADYPKAFEGFPIALVTAGLMALAFMGFSGLKVW